MTKRLGCYLLLSAALHLLLLWLTGFAPSSSPSALPTARAGGGRLEARLRVPDSSEKLVGPTVVQTGARSVPPSETSPAEMEKLVPSPAPDGVPVPLPLPVLPASLPRGFDRDSYLPGDRLDFRPRPEQPVIIDLGEPDVLGAEKGQVVLVVFVGADGNVDLVDVDSADVPVAIAGQVAALFHQTRMLPGLLDGQPVKSRMRILVEFEARRLMP